MLALRAAILADVGTLVLLNREVQALHARLFPGFFKAEPDSEAAHAFFCAKFATEQNRFVLALNHLSVQPEVRRKGVASALIRHVEQVAREAELQSVALSAWVANSPAIRFFEAAGYGRTQTDFSKAAPQS